MEFRHSIDTTDVDIPEKMAAFVKQQAEGK
jgi:hypothetical protein